MTVSYEDGWQSVKDHLPPMDVPVIVARAGQVTSFEALRKKNKFGKGWYWTNAVWNYQPIEPIASNGGITHWRAFPKAPEKEEAER